MVNKLIKIFLCFAISISFAQDNTNSNSTNTKYVNVTIEGMHCSVGCAKSIENQLNNTEGLVAMVNFDNSKALVEYNTKLFSDQDVVDIINNYQGGKYTASLLDTKKSTCSKGKQCCQKTGKPNPSCDNKAKGCCSSASKKTCKKK